MLRFKTLGQVFLQRDGVRVAGAAAQPRRLALLAILAAAGHRGVSRERLMGLLWTDTDEERARKGLNQALYALRQEIGSDEAITGTRDLVLAADQVITDIAEFHAAISAADLERAVAIYEGQFLDGFHLPGAPGFERWMETERSGLARDHATALEKLARRAEERHDNAAAVEWWRRLAALDPLDGKTTFRLMEALVRADDRVSALKQARIYEVLLSQELDLPPDRGVIDLAERIRAMEAAPAPAAVPVVTPVATPVATPVVTPVATPAVQTPVEPVVQMPVEPVVQPAISAPPRIPTPQPVTLGAPMTPVMPGAPTRTLARPRKSRRRLGRWLMVAGIGVVSATVLAVRSSRGPLARPDLGASRKITVDAGLEVDPVLAPDGRTLAYAQGPEGAMHIFVRRLDGGRAVRVSGDLPGDHRRPRWSPDGSRLVFQAGGGLWIVPALGGTPRSVIAALPDPAGRALYPEWSPDGQTLVWVRRDTLYARPVGGGSARAIATVAEAHSLAWSPDGRWIATVSGNEGFAYGAGASTMDIGFISIGNLAPSSIWLIPAKGGNPVRVAAGNHLNTSPAWLGRDRLLYVSDRDGSRDIFAQTLSENGEPLGDPMRLTTGLNAHTVSTQQDGHALAYSVFTLSSNIWSLPIPSGAPVGTTAATPVTSGTQVVEAMDVSPDGQWLAFDADGAGSQDIYRLPLGGGEAERVVETATDDHRPVWAPDGRSILFYSFLDGVRRAFVVPAEGGDPRPLVPAGREEQHTPVWSPDMRHVLYHRPERGVDQIFELTKTGDSTWSAPRQLTKRGGFGGRWSADGTQLAYVSPRQVRVMGDGSDGEATSRLLYDGSVIANKPNPVAIRWAPDGREIYMKTFDVRGQAALWRLDLGGGPPRLLVKFDEPLRPTRRPEFATDGRRLYFTLAQSESDIWVMGLRDRR